ncbi:MAG TPA: N-acetylglucosamine-6-phosphate deacetylase [Vicinamibacterales bacterium]|nr:N-acetylglucosamine-6-phosphate deacetylase [Vicinamibacterales bacterium]
MIVLSGAALVLPDRILSPGTLVIENGRIAEVRPDPPSAGSHEHFAFHDHYIVPGFIDVHVHGVDGVDSLDDRPGADSIATIAAQLPRYGVTAFCPTTVACAPEALRRVLDQVRQAREHPSGRAARVLPAHLESNFINPEYCGAQPLVCLRAPTEDARKDGDFTAVDILREIERAAPDIAIVTIAPELDGGLELVRWLAARIARVSLGHSGATYDEALEAIGAGARHATHLFNRMPPLAHRAPGLAGAVLQTDEVAAEIICDGVHVHPAMVRTAVAAKRPSRVFAITDGTALSGMPVGARAQLGGRTITAGSSAAVLDDGTLAGSTVTMERAFQTLIGRIGLSLVDAVTLCATTPARELGLVGHGVLAPEAVADLVVLDSMFSVVQTYVGGQLVYTRNASPNPER